jgi:O-antigen ligase
MLVLGALAFTHRPTLWLCVSSVAFGSVLAACLALPAQMAAGGRYEIGGTYDPNETGALFVITLPILFMLAGEKGRTRAFALLGIPILLAGLVRTGSRGAVVGLALLMPFFIAYAPPRRRGMYIALIGVSAVVFGATASDDLRQRLTGLFSGSDYNFTEREGRQAVWKRGIGYMVANPLLGVGVDAFPFAEGASLGNEGRGIKYSAAHNAYIQIGAELGILGGIAFIGALVSATAGCLRARRRAVARVHADPQERRHEISVTTAAVGSLIGAIITAMFLSLAYSNLMYFVLALGIGVAIGSEDATSGTQHPSPLAAAGRDGTGRVGHRVRGGR